jgi:hypothetical protein
MICSDSLRQSPRILIQSQAMASSQHMITIWLVFTTMTQELIQLKDDLKRKLNAGHSLMKLLESSRTHGHSLSAKFKQHFKDKETKVLIMPSALKDNIDHKDEI